MIACSDKFCWNEEAMYVSFALSNTMSGHANSAEAPCDKSKLRECHEFEVRVETRHAPSDTTKRGAEGAVALKLPCRKLLGSMDGHRDLDIWRPLRAYLPANMEKSVMHRVST